MQWEMKNMHINCLLQMDGGSGDFETVFDNRLEGVQVDEQDGEYCLQSIFVK
jgi:hypothetical protein